MKRWQEKIAEIVSKHFIQPKGRITADYPLYNELIESMEQIEAKAYDQGYKEGIRKKS